MAKFLDAQGLKTLWKHTKTTIQTTADEINQQVADLESSVTQKQDVLVSGTNIKTINGTSLLGEGDLIIENSHVITKVDSIDDIPDDETRLYRYNIINEDTGVSTSSSLVEVASTYHAAGNSQEFRKTTTDNNKEVKITTIANHFDTNLSNFVTFTEVAYIWSLYYSYNNEVRCTGLRLGSSASQGSITVNLTSEGAVLVTRYYAINGSTGEVVSNNDNSQVIVDGTTYYLSTVDEVISIPLSAGTHTITNGADKSTRATLLGFSFGGEEYYSFEKYHIARQENLEALESTVTANKNDFITKHTELKNTVASNTNDLTRIQNSIGSVQIFDTDSLPRASMNQLNKIYRKDKQLYQCVSVGDGVYKEYTFNLAGTSEISASMNENAIYQFYTSIGEDFGDYWNVNIEGLTKVFRNNNNIKLGSSSATGNIEFTPVCDLPISVLKLGVQAYNTKNSTFLIEVEDGDGNVYYNTYLISDAATETIIDLGKLFEEMPVQIHYLYIATRSEYEDEDGNVTTTDKRGLVTRLIADFGEVNHIWTLVGSDILMPVTYAELRGMRNNNKLVPGQQYRITDYITTTTEADTRSAGHQFDIIVTADSTNTLNEHARATFNDTDLYFKGEEMEILSAKFQEGVTRENIQLMYKLSDDKELDYGTGKHDHVILDLTTIINEDGVTIPAFRDVDPEGSARYVNNVVPIIALIIDDETVYAPRNYHKDVFVELGYNDEGTPILYKTDPIEKGVAGITDVDYAEFYVYNGQMEWDEAIYDNWVKWETSFESDTPEATQYQVLTPIIVDENREFTITNEELQAGIEFVAGDDVGYAMTYYYVGTHELDGEVYDCWKENSVANYWFLTNRVVDVIIGYTTLKARLEAWEIKYCLDNDKDRFAWADETNGTGVIYYMKDEWGNECPYDFKNIQFKRYKALWNDNPYNGFDDQYICLKDRYGNVTPRGYNIKDDNDYIWTYTFHRINLGTNKHSDATVQAAFNEEEAEVFENTGWSRFNTVARDNVIKEYKSDNLARLNDIVFVNEYQLQSYEDGGYNVTEVYCYDNVFSYNCYSNTFGNYCYSNKFGRDNNKHTFGTYCNFNIFGQDCYSNIAGNDFYSNVFGNSCYDNTFGEGCDSNMFGKYCYSNIFGNYCYSNTFGNHCYSNTFDDAYYNNEFKDRIGYIHLKSAEPFNEDNWLDLQNIIINSRVHGSYKKPREIIVERGLQYTTTFSAPSSKEIILDEDEEE